MDISFLDKIFLEQFSVRLKIKQKASLPFFHCNIIYGLLKDALNRHPLGQEIIIYPVESSRIIYEAGDYYNFGVSLLKKDDSFLQKLEEGLKNLSLINNGEKDVTLQFEEPEVKKLPRTDFTVFPINNTGHTKLKFITPLRMEKGKGKKYDYFEDTYFDPSRFLFLLYNRLYDLAKLNGEPIAAYQKPLIPECSVTGKNFIWADVPARDKKLGGIIGSVELKGEPDSGWQKILYMGQFLHAGNNSSFGLGKYLLNGAGIDIFNIKKEKTFLDAALSVQNLTASFKKLKLKSSAAGVDGISVEEFEGKLQENLSALNKEVREGAYKPNDLLGFFIKESETKTRPLAIPSVGDRVLTRALAEAVAPSIDKLLEENSFAFRKGLSRKIAADKIEIFHKEGYNYVLKSDIESFFDNVDWNILFQKLDSLFINDPILPIIKMSIQLPVIYNGVKFTRSKGLPQGLPLSPLLANLYLDEFDDALGDEFRLIRYADDFVILCKSKDEFINAKEKTEKELKNLKLELKTSKTQEASFDEGFDFLGYHFLQWAYTQNKKNKSIKKSNERTGFISSNKWLLKADPEDLHPVKKTHEQEPYKLHTSEEAQAKFPVYITEPGALVHLENETLVVSSGGEEPDIKKIPLDQISSLLFYTKPCITFPAVIKINNEKIPQFFSHPNGKLYFSVPAAANDYSLWLEQYKLSLNGEFCLDFAKKNVAAKIHNSRSFILRSLEENDQTVKLKSLQEDCTKAETLDSLRGIEGSASAIYFKLLRSLIPEEWKFLKRVKNPPTDPVNVLLSLGYSVVYNHLSSALQITGLNPEIGFFHSPASGHNALASDLVEEFRFLTESIALYCIHKNIVTLNDFELVNDGVFPCRFKGAGFKKYLAAFEQRLMDKVKYIGDEPLAYRAVFMLKAKNVLHLVRGNTKEYKVFEIK